MGSTFTKTYLKSTIPLLLAILFAGLLFVACKKRKAFKEENGQIAVELRMVQGQTDEALKDINLIIMNRSLLRGKPAGGDGMAGLSICGLDLDTSFANQGIVTVNYNGEECNGLKKSGTVKFTIQGYPVQKWKHQGCVIKIEFIKYVSTLSSDGRSIQLDGTLFLTNTSGKTWYDLVYLYESGVSQILTGSGVVAKFGASETEVFSFNRQMNFSYSKKDSVIVCQVTGLGTSDGKSNLGNWGQDKDGNAITNEVTKPLIWKTSCGAYVLFEGEENTTIAGKAYDISSRFGLDQEGNDESSTNGSCPYGWKSTWTYKKKSNSRIFNYK